MLDGTRKVMGKEYKFFKGKNQRVRYFKLIFVCMHHLINSMHKYLREAISNDDSFIYYLQFLLLNCLMPVFCIKLLFIFSFILQLTVLFIFIIWILILSLIIIAKKKFNTFNSLSQFPWLYFLIENDMGI